jgi:hypothetical protein
LKKIAVELNDRAWPGRIVDPDIDARQPEAHEPL